METIKNSFTKTKKDTLALTVSIRFEAVKNAQTLE